MAEIEGLTEEVKESVVERHLHEMGSRQYIWMGTERFGLWRNSWPTKVWIRILNLLEWWDPEKFNSMKTPMRKRWDREMTDFARKFTEDMENFWEGEGPFYFFVAMDELQQARKHFMMREMLYNFDGTGVINGFRALDKLSRKVEFHLSARDLTFDGLHLLAGGIQTALVEIADREPERLRQQSDGSHRE